MTPSEQQLIDLLFDINKIKSRCERLQVPIAIPPIVYTKFDELNVEVTRWGMACVAEERREKGDPK